MAALKLTAEEVAAAARVQKGTLYRILSGRTKQPHYSTLRRLCKVLQLDIASVLCSEQLEIIKSRFDSESPTTELEELLRAQVRSFPEAHRTAAIEAVVFALVCGDLESGHRPPPGFDALKQQIRAASAEAAEILMIQRLRDVPREVRPTTVQYALGFLVDLRLALGASPEAAMYRPMLQLRYRWWTTLDLPKRRRVPQN